MFTTVYRDDNGDLWAEYPEGSGSVVSLDASVLRRVAEKFGSHSIADVTGLGLTRLVAEDSEH